MSKPIVVVLGATGLQGGSVVRNLLKSGKFSVRAVTRNVGGDAAKKLGAQGIEVVEGNFNNKESLLKAFKGAWGVFATTQAWDPENLKAEGKLELEQGIKVADAAAESKLGFAVVSVLDDVHKASSGRLHVPHFTYKAHIEEAWRKSSVPSAFVLAGAYLQNYLTMMKPRPAADGVLEFTSVLRHDVGTPVVDIDDIGLPVATLFENPKEWAGKRVDVSSGYVTMPQLAEIYGKILNKPTRYNRIPYEVAKSFMGNELTAMLQYFNEFGYFLGRDVSSTRKQWPAMRDAESFFRANSAAL